MNKKPLIALLLVSTLALSGCNEEAKALYASPQVQDVGEFDGCQVKFVNRGYEIASFYIARCGSTVTTTTNWNQRSGKSSTFRRSTVINDEIEKLQAEKAESEAREKALSKLSPAEREALGIK